MNIHRIARITSDIINPFLLSIIVIFLITLSDTGSSSDAFKWVAIALVLSVVPVFIVMLVMVRKKSIDGLFVKTREQRHKVYAIAALVTAAGLAVLVWFDAPPMLRTVFVSGIVSILVYMVVNFFWKISLHTAFAAASATIMTIIYGSAGAMTFVLVPTVAWSRIILKMHTPAQVTAGAIGSAAIVFVMFWSSGHV